MKLTLVHCLLNQNGSPHVGLLSLAAYVKKNLKWIDLKVVESVEPLSEIVKNKPDVVGFTADTIAYNRTVEIATEVRKKLKRVKLVLGGVHITACPSAIGNPFDVGVTGEGEIALEELLYLFDKKKRIKPEDWLKIKGLVYLENGKIVKTSRREFIKDIDILPFPAREMVDMEGLYLNNQVNLYGVKRMVNLMTSRGCPYHCIYCGSPVQWGSVRFHSAEYILKEIKWIVKKYKADGIVFSDDLFIVPKDRLLKLVELIKKEKELEKIVFSGFAKANVLDDEICQALKSINVRRLTFGFESYNEKTLAYLKDRSVTAAQNIKAIELCHKYGIAVASGLIVGTPGEGVKEIKETYEMMKKYPMDNSQIYILTPYPGTKTWDTAEKEGLVALDMNMEKLFVQIPLSASLKFWKKDKFYFLKDRIFLNTKMRHNQEYLGIILKMNALAFWQNLVYYVKTLGNDPGLVIRVLKNYL